jgi:hypothetical protein
MAKKNTLRNILFGKPAPRTDWSGELQAWQSSLAGYQRQLAGRRRRFGPGDDSTTRGLKADIESCRRAIRLYRS